MLLGYALVSAADPVPWCSLDAAQKHIALVEAATRASARGHRAAHYRILEAEMPARNERVGVGQAEPNLNLSDIIELIVQRRSIWPILSELKGWKGKGWVNKKGLPGHNQNQAPSSSWQTNQWQASGWQDYSADKNVNRELRSFIYN